MFTSTDAILVTGSRAPCALILARTLRDEGFMVYTSDSLRPNLGQGSPAVTADFLLPSPRFQPECCARALTGVVENHTIGMLIPTCEEVYHLAAIRHWLPPGLRCFFPPLGVLNRLHNKYAASRLAESLGIRVPAVRLLNDSTDLRALDWDHDAVIKRVYSRFGNHVLLLLGSAQVRRAAASKIKINDGDPWIYQEYVRGQSICSYSLCRAGHVVYHVAYTTPYTVGPGAGIYYKSTQGSPTLEVARRLASATGFTGQLSLDFIENSAGLWFLECNPRATMGLALAAETPEFGAVWRSLLLAETGQIRRWQPPISQVEAGRSSPPGLGDQGGRSSPPGLGDQGGRSSPPGLGDQGGRSSPPELGDQGGLPEETRIAPPGIRRQMTLAMLLYGWRNRAANRTWGCWLQDLLTTRDALSSRKDPGVWIRQLKALASYAIRAHALGMPVIEFTTHDIEWNGAEARAAGLANEGLPIVNESSGL